jgi:hypothetical protein
MSNGGVPTGSPFRPGMRGLPTLNFTKRSRRLLSSHLARNSVAKAAGTYRRSSR